MHIAHSRRDTVCLQTILHCAALYSEIVVDQVVDEIQDLLHSGSGQWLRQWQQQRQRQKTLLDFSSAPCPSVVRYTAMALDKASCC
jgi:hypothetical protein